MRKHFDFHKHNMSTESCYKGYIQKSPDNSVYNKLIKLTIPTLISSKYG